VERDTKGPPLEFEHFIFKRDRLQANIRIVKADVQTAKEECDSLETEKMSRGLLSRQLPFISLAGISISAA
jgi:hypothetical protein